MGLVAAIIIPLIIIILLMVNKISIDWRSFFKKGLPLDRESFGIYCYDGKQGTGKTYAMTRFLKEESAGRKIYSNMSFKGIEYTKIENLDQLFALSQKKKVIIVYDEILNILNNQRVPQDIRDDLMEFMTQQRKVKNILMTSTQSWLRVPIEFRDFVRIQIKVSTIPLGRLGGILIQEYRDADQMVYDKDVSEYVAPRISLKISKYKREILESYDTYEKVKKLQRSLDHRSSGTAARPRYRGGGVVQQGVITSM